MNDSTKDQRNDSIRLSEPESQAMHKLMVSSRARDQFREHAHTLHRIRKNRKETTSKWNLLEAESDARICLDLAEAAELAGEMAPSHRFFMRVSAIERVHDQRWFEGLYDEDLAFINAQKDAIRQREGLDEDEEWNTGKGPADWEELNDQYEHILDMKFENALREYDLNDIADIHHTDRDTFDALREEGRRLVFENIPVLEKLSFLQQQYENEASICAQNKAYLAAAAMIGSAMETALLFICLNHRDNALEAYKRLSDKKRPKSNNPEKWTFNQLVMIVDKAGWLPDLIVDDVIISSYKLTNIVRNFRNMLHPVCHLSDKRFLDVEGQYANVQAVYDLLKHHFVEPWNG